jgi:hypothetical protein
MFNCHLSFWRIGAHRVLTTSPIENFGSSELADVGQFCRPDSQTRLNSHSGRMAKFLNPKQNRLDSDVH